MPTIHINGIPYEAHAGERLSACLSRLGLSVEHPCGGRGTCGKCTVTVNGRPALSCQYIIRGDAVVETPPPAAMATELDAIRPSDNSPACGDLALDIGTTTLALALVNPSDGGILRAETATNPQRAFGADVLSRISCASEQGTAALSAPLRDAINRMIERIRGENARPYRRMVVAGNTTMLHLFLGVDPTPLGVAPYTPAFLEEKHLSAADCGIRGVDEVILLPGIAAFAGADLVAGIHAVGWPTGASYRLLVDLGTNAEIALFNRDGILCTAAAAGPCFEGASISCGMSATEGAIYAYDSDGSYETIADAPPRGLCGTGLVDAVAALLERGIVDEGGYMECSAFYLCEGICLLQEDIRRYQTAKAAVHAGILSLMARAKISPADIEKVYIAGGFAAKLRVDRAVRTGLLPAALADRVSAVGNSSLAGACRRAAVPADLTDCTRRARYVDLASDPTFAKAFMEQMMFAPPRKK